MKNCPVCNEFLGDNVEKCIKCGYLFQKRVFYCCKCHKILPDERSSCECGGWATSDTAPNQYYTPIGWSRKELKEAAKSRLKSTLKLAIIVCLLLSIVTYVKINTRIPFYVYTYGKDGIQTEYYDRGTKEFTYVDHPRDVPAELDLKITLISIPLIKDIPAPSARSISFYILLITLPLLIFLYWPYKIGVNRFFMANIHQRTNLKAVLYAFSRKNYLPIVKTIFIMNIKLSLWTLLFIVPGIVKYYEYRMIPYFLSENPEIDSASAYRLSRDMMNGHKWDVFVLDLSFILWYLLSSFTLGIAAIIWVIPYNNATISELYQKFRNNFLQARYVSEDLLKGYDN